MNIAITGAIGSGKSLVAKALASLIKGELCDTDLVCKDLLEKGNPGWQGVVKKWGQMFLEENGDINRSFLRSTIFNDQEIRNELEMILHPLVRKHVKDLMLRAISERRILVVEVPLLFEAGWQSDFDYVITVSAKTEVCLKRVMLRDGVSEDQVMKILNSQMDLQEKINCSDYVIDNSGEQTRTIAKVKKLFTHLSKNIISKKS